VNVEIKLVGTNVVIHDKPWQDPLSKASKKGGKEVQRERTRVQAKKTKPKMGYKRVAKEQIMLQSLH
jgi:hypothetical protein